MGTSFDLGVQNYNQRLAENNRLGEQDRLARQAKLSAIVGDSLNALPLPKDDKGNPDINNPAYNDIMQRRQKLIGSLMDEYTPVQHANIVQRIGGLITGNKQHAMPHPNQPLPAMGTGPHAAAAQALDEQSAQAQQDLQQSQIPQQPMETVPVQSNPFTPLPDGHPAHKITEGIKALGEGLKNHLQAFAHPDLKKPDQSGLINNIAQSYQDPKQLEHERAMELWGLRGDTAEKVAEIRGKYMAEGRKPQFLSQLTLPHLIEQRKIDPDLEVYGPDGRLMSDAQLAEMPQSMIVRKFQKGAFTFFSLGDQNSKTVNVGGQIFDIPAVGPINLNGPDANSTVLGQATSTLQKNSISEDQYGNVNKAKHTTEVPPVGATPAPAPSANPGLLTRPVSSAAPAPPSGPLAAVNAQIAAGNATSPKLNKGKPVSAAAPPMPSGSHPSLDENGNIPEGVGNPQVRQFANDLLNDRDVDKIPPKARAAAEAMARPYGWEQGKFTPREINQIQETQTLLTSMSKDPAIDAVYNENAIKRGIISARIHGKSPGGAAAGVKETLANQLLSPVDVNFIQTYRNMLGRIQALSQLTRGGSRQTEQSVQRMIAELPDPSLVSSPQEAKKSFQLIQNEIDIAMKKRDWSGGGGPVSKNAPSSAPPKVGDTKTFPNGKKGTWDGTGYVAVAQ